MRIAVTGYDTLPWTAIQYIVGVINYGGRVTDYLDNRCLQCIAMRFFTPQLFDQDTKFDPTGLYFAPEPAPKEKVLEYVFCAATERGAGAIWAPFQREHHVAVQVLHRASADNHRHPA